MRPTVHDIAAEAGVSLATVDRVLNGRPGVAPADGPRKVETAVSRLGYVRDVTAANLARRRIYPLVFVIPAGPNSFMRVLEAEIYRSDGSFFRGADFNPDRKPFRRSIPAPSCMFWMRLTRSLSRAWRWLPPIQKRCEFAVDRLIEKGRSGCDTCVGPAGLPAGAFFAASTILLPAVPPETFLDGSAPAAGGKVAGGGGLAEAVRSHRTGPPASRRF